MVKDMAGLGAMIKHAKVYRTVTVVPVEVDPEEDFSRPVDGACILLGEVVSEVLGVGFVDVFVSEVIHYQAKMEGAVFVSE